MLITRGMRNNNPGNIRHSKDKWQSLAAQQPDADFCTFENPIYGIRAIARILINYQDEQGINTISAIFTEWSPPKENPTAALIKNALERTGFDADQQLN